MRDWSRLLHSVAKLSYDEIVEKGKENVTFLLEIIEKYSDSDSAPIILVGLAAYTATVDDELSPIEIKLITDIIGISEKDFHGFVEQVKADKRIISDLRDIAIAMNTDELTYLATLLALIFAVDGNISDHELAFLKDLCC